MAFTTEQPGRTIKWDGSGALPTVDISAGTEAINESNGDIYKFAGDFGWIQTHAAGQLILAQGAGERNPEDYNNYAVGNDECTPTRWDYSAGAEINGSVVLTSNQGVLYGYILWERPVTNSVLIRDGVDATGIDKGEIPQSTISVGQFVPFKGGVFENGIFIDLNGATAGNVTFLWRDK